MNGDSRYTVGKTENSNPNCRVGRNIHRILDNRLLEVQKAMEEKLSQMTLADVKKMRNCA